MDLSEITLEVEKITTNVSDANVADYDYDCYISNDGTLEELKELLSEIMIKILGENHASEITYLNGLLHPTRTSEMFDAITEEEIVAHEFVPKRIHINRQLATIQVASTGHEYIHALLSKYKGHNFNKHLTNIHYNELLSVLTEYVIVYELSQILKDESLREKHSILRAKHDKDHALEHKAADGLSTKLHKAVLDRHTLEALKLYLDYESHNSFGYILSDIYSRRLFTMYQDDPQVLLTILTSIGTLPAIVSIASSKVGMALPSFKRMSLVSILVRFDT